YFRANNTGYMVLQFEQGASLKGWLKGLGRAPRQTEIDKLVAPLLDALEVIHKAEFLHRDIAPDNIMVRKDGSPVLIDFGSARGDIARHSRTVSALVKPGYSPYEQYAETGARQGPWTDFYALAATLYHAITGKRPPDSPSRIVKDDYIKAKDAALASYRPRFLAAIDRALDLDIERRPKSVVEWRGELLAPEPKPAKKSWLGEEIQPKPEPKPKAKAKTVALPPTEILPSPPDAPGPKGGILDFFEGLKKKAQPQPTEPVTEKLASPPPPPSVQAAQPEPLAVKPEPVRPLKARAAMTPQPPPPPTRIEAPAAMPRPRPVRAGRGHFGRRVAVVLLLGAGVASATFGLRDRLPNLELRRGVVPTSSTTRPALEPLATLDIRGHTGGTIGVGFAGDQVVTAGADGSLKVWSGSSGALQRSIAGTGSSISSLAVLSRRAVTGHGDGSAILWDLDRGERLATFKRNEASIWSVAFAGSEGRIATAGHDWSVVVWDAASPSSPREVFEGHESAAQAVAFSAAKGFVASGGADKFVRLWNVETGSLVRSYRGHKDFVTAVDFSGDGRLLASADLDGSIRVWSAASNRHVATLNGHRGRVNAIAFAPSGEMLASVGEDGALRLWDARRGHLLRLFSAAGEQGVG
ncbi:MAG: protein kinase, partial [Hyphomicrobiaceae bacterium]